MSNSAGIATARPMVTTSFDTAEAVRRCRKISHSSAIPSNGATITTARTTDGTMPHPQSVLALK